MNKNENSFFEPRTLLAIVLVAVVWIGWQSYLSKKYPAAVKPEVVSTAEPKASINNKEQSFPPIADINKAIETPGKEELIQAKSSTATFELSSFGMGLKNLTLAKYAQRNGTPVEFARGLEQGIFRLHLADDPKPIIFLLSKESENVFVGTAQVGKTRIVRTIRYNPETFSFQNDVSVLNPDSSFKGISLVLQEKKDLDASSGGFFSTSSDKQEFLISQDGKSVDIYNVTGIKEDVNNTRGLVLTMSLSSHYFASAVVDKSEIAPEAHILAKVSEDSFTGTLTYRVSSIRDKMDFHFISYSGPKSAEILEKADKGLVGIIDLGFFGVIVRWLLVILKWFNDYLSNWGFSIVALTLLVRALVLPFNIASYKSMKKMQNVQPKIQSLRERYKEDVATQQREIMALMKAEKVNPLGGCLPMLLQMPIFFALFKALGTSIDLYQAPFIWWIHDLSLKDPYYILPALMGITLFIQQKITPSTMDPQQAKIMQFMPILFTLFMVSLPSGLTLYTFVSTLFGILQQRFFMRDHNQAVNVREAKT